MDRGLPILAGARVPRRLRTLLCAGRDLPRGLAVRVPVGAVGI